MYLGFLTDLYGTISWFVFVLLRGRLELHMTFPVEHDFGDLLVQLILGILQALLQLVGYEV